MLRIKFIGAARTVTGSCFLVEGDQGNIMIDCGMFQGPKKLAQLNRETRDYIASKVDRLVLTHAHIDHSGLIPRLCQNGFQGTIHAHGATADLASIMLPDSGYIQELETEWRNRKLKRQGKKLLEPLYTKLQAEKCQEQFSSLSYDTQAEVGDGFRITLRDAGHILGSAIVELEALDRGEWRKIIFSGDIGNVHPPILREPSTVDGGEVVLCESTYGGRLHEGVDEKREILQGIIRSAVEDHGKVIIPAFAIGRTQEIVYILNDLYRHNAIPKIPVYIDSPLAISATEIFRRHPECYDEETKQLIESGTPALDFPTLTLTTTVEASRAINEKSGPAVVISASGMCEAGRIKHHLKHNLYKPQAHIVFAGFQANGTLGSRIREGAKQVKVFGEDIAVRAKIHSVGAFSAHADRDGLTNWLAAMKRRPDLVCLVHGEGKQIERFDGHIRDTLGLNTFVPERGDILELDDLDGAGKKRGIVDDTSRIEKDIDALRKWTSDLSGKLSSIRKRLKSGKLKPDDEEVLKLHELTSRLRDEVKQIDETES